MGNDFPSNHFFKGWFLFVAVVVVVMLGAGIYFGYELVEWIKTK